MKKASNKGRVTLERALSKLGLASRTESCALIESGQVKVHGVLELNPLRQVNPDTAHIELKGSKAIKAASQLILFHKPKGVVTTKRDPEGRPTVYDFLPEQYQSFHPVGRLDMHTTGLLLLTNDTRLSSYLTDPVQKIERVYVVKVRGKVMIPTTERMMMGVDVDGVRLIAKNVNLLKSSARESLLRMILEEGKNREIRNLCLTLGHEVVGLKRISFGSFQLGDLAPGSYQVGVAPAHFSSPA